MIRQVDRVTAALGADWSTALRLVIHRDLEDVVAWGWLRRGKGRGLAGQIAAAAIRGGEG
jgi:hypothetical protein